MTHAAVLPRRHRRRELVRAEARSTGSTSSRCSPRSRTLLVHCFAADRPARRAQRASSRAACASAASRSSGRRAPTSSPGRLRADEQARVDQLDDPTAALVVRASQLRRLLDLHAAARRARGDRPDEPAAGLRHAALDGRRSRSRSTARASSTARPTRRASEPEPPAPQIDYLAKDYASFRRLMLDRLSVLVPDWRERNAADTLMTLVELLAYAADSLSYFQDAAATEAYLGTARRRASVRRHARLVDYHMHDGASARVWVALEVGDGRRRRAAARDDGADRRGRRRAGDSPRPTSAQALVARRARVRDAARRSAARERATRSSCTTGATTLLPARRRHAGDARRHRGEPRAAAGDVLIFEEVRDPGLGNPERRRSRAPPRRPARRRSRARVRTRRRDAGRRRCVEVCWHADDALPFALRLRTRCAATPACVARGNVVLADHGGTTLTALGAVEREELGAAVAGRAVPAAARPPAGDAVAAVRRSRRAAAARGRRDARRPAARRPGRCPVRRGRALGAGARAAQQRPVRRRLRGRDRGGRVRPGALRRRRARPRSRRPARRRSRRRTASAPAGPATSAPAPSRRIVTDLAVTSVSNPLPATGGADPEPLEHVRLYAPQAFRTQKRAVTEADYAAFAERHPEVQKAGATRRWTGSWYTIFITVDRVGGRADRRCVRGRAARVPGPVPPRRPRHRDRRARTSCRCELRAVGLRRAAATCAATSRRRCSRRSSSTRRRAASSIPTSSRSASRCT